MGLMDIYLLTQVTLERRKRKGVKNENRRVKRGRKTYKEKTGDA